jgi:hypothetical protein
MFLPQKLTPGITGSDGQRHSEQFKCLCSCGMAFQTSGRSFCSRHACRQRFRIRMQQGHDQQGFPVARCNSGGCHPEAMLRSPIGLPQKASRGLPSIGVLCALCTCVCMYVVCVHVMSVHLWCVLCAFNDGRVLPRRKLRVLHTLCSLCIHAGVGTTECCMFLNFFVCRGGVVWRKLCKSRVSERVGTGIYEPSSVLVLCCSATALQLVDEHSSPHRSLGDEVSNGSHIPRRCDLQIGAFAESAFLYGLRIRKYRGLAFGMKPLVFVCACTGKARTPHPAPRGANSRRHRKVSGRLTPTAGT